jgi:5-methyltetrahydrofolate--homocysteine methyltransferase
VSDVHQLYQAVLVGDAPAALAAARRALGEGVPPLGLVEDAISPAMAEVGRRFEAGDYFVPELLIAARATKGVFELIRPLLVQGGAPRVGRVVLGTVLGDQHDIGKNLVATMLEGDGFEVIDLGVNVAAERFVAAVEQQRPDLIGLSALLTTTLPAMATTLSLLRARGVSGGIKIMVGGAPVTQAYAEAIGADGYAPNAASAVQLARRLLAA